MAIKTVTKLKVIITSVVIIKILVLIVGSHPFDFATYVYQARSFFEYGITPLFSWNKGMPLLGLFYMQYALYQFLTNVFFASFENTVLLHILFKLPFLLFDLLCGYLLYRLTLPVVGPKKATAVLLLWLCNPFTLWTVELHGSYAITATFFSLLSLLLLTKRRYALSMVALAVGVSVYYYAIIFVPFYLIKIVSDNRPGPWIRRVLASAAAFLTSIFIFYAPFLFSGRILLSSLIASLLNHSAPNAASTAQTIQLPDYSFLKIPYYTVTRQFPTNLSAPLVFKLAALLTYLGLALIAGYTVYRFWLYLKNSAYSFKDLSLDLLITTSLFLLFVGQFQDHYLVWVFPYMLLVGLLFSSKRLLRYTYYVGFVAFLGVLGAGNLGIYMLDVIPFGTVSVYAQQNAYNLALGGFTILILLIGNLFLFQSQTTDLLAFETEDKIMVGLTTAAFVFLAAVSVVALSNLTTQKGPSVLGDDQGVYNYVYTPMTSSYRLTKTVLTTVAVPDSGFDSNILGPISSNSKIPGPASPWFFYNYGNANVSAAIVSTPHSGTKSLLISPHSNGTAAQLNMGGSGSKNLLPIDPNTRYQASVFLMLHDLPLSAVKSSVRFADSTRRIIPGSDLILNPQAPTGQWQQSSLYFVPPKTAAYVELLFSVSPPKSVPVTAQSSVDVDDFALQQVNEYSTLHLAGLTPKGDADAIRTYILNNRAKPHFNYQFLVNEPPSGGSVSSVSFGTCSKPADLFNNKPYVTALFSPSCVPKAGTTDASITLSNYSSEPQVSLSLVHTVTFKHTVNYHSWLYEILAAVGTVGLLGLLVYTGRSFKNLGGST